MDNRSNRLEEEDKGMLATDHRCSPELETDPGGKPHVLTAAEMMRYLETVQELPTLSTIAIRANAMLLSVDTTARDLAQVIEKDQSLVSKLLKLANSSFFGFGSRVSNVAHAVMILGFNAVLNAILSMAVIDAFKVQKYKRIGLDMISFWRHSIAVAVTARHLSRAVSGQRNENAFTAGILHDIGKIVMAIFFTDRFIELQQSIGAGKGVFLEAEQRYFPLGHAPIGAFLAHRWNLPGDLTAVIAQHHHPAGTLSSLNNLVELVHTADALVNIHLEQNGPPQAWPICSTAWKLAGDKIRTAGQWIPEIKEETEEACRSILEEC
jgi:putative nucleotidyltransferase with HDIG domain